MIVLGIESSCDDTSIAILNNNTLLSHICSSQNNNSFGGVFPEYAAREHLSSIDPTMRMSLQQAKCKLSDIECIGVTNRPGLLGSLVVGVSYAKALSLAHNIPIIGIHHLEAHLVVPQYTHNIQFPYGVILLSGGHSMIILAHSLGQYEILGTTKDDAVGELFDKVARCIGLKQPGGPEIEKCALQGNTTIDLPVPLRGDMSYDLSFSGLKTAAQRKWNDGDKSDIYRSNLCFSLQNTIYETLKERMMNVWMKYCTENWVLVGGVAANKYLRNRLRELCDENKRKLIVPPANLCTDNGVMVAYAALLRAEDKLYDDLSLRPYARAKL